MRHSRRHSVLITSNRGNILTVEPVHHGKLSLGKARELARMPFWRFRQLLAAREVAPHYDVADVEDDRTALRELGLA